MLFMILKDRRSGCVENGCCEVSVEEGRLLGGCWVSLSEE